MENHPKNKEKTKAGQVGKILRSDGSFNIARCAQWLRNSRDNSIFAPDANLPSICIASVSRPGASRSNGCCTARAMVAGWQYMRVNAPLSKHKFACRLQRAFYYLRQFGRGECDRIGFHTAGVNRLLDEIRNVACGDAVCPERLHSEMFTQPEHPVGAVFRHRIRIIRYDTGNFGIPAERAMPRRPFAQRPDIHFHAMRQDRRADCSVWGIEHAPDGRGKSVDDTKARVSERETSEKARQRHILTRLRIADVVICALQM